MYFESGIDKISLILDLPNALDICFFGFRKKELCIVFDRSVLIYFGGNLHVVL